VQPFVGSDGRAQAQPGQTRLPRAKSRKYQFEHSKIFPGTIRDYSVYVPKQYDPAKPACVHVNQDGIQFNAPAVSDDLINKNEMPVTIGVFITPGRVKAPKPDALDRFNRSFEYDGLGADYVRFLLDELLPEVETKKTSDGRPIRLSKEGNDRSIAGSSSGAICAFTAAWNAPTPSAACFLASAPLSACAAATFIPHSWRKTEPKPLRVYLETAAPTSTTTAATGGWPIRKWNGR